MEYEVYITRRKNWFDKEDPVIPEEIWPSAVGGHLQMSLTGVAEIKTPEGEFISYENPLLALWSGHSKEEKVWFDYRDGNIAVKNPDDKIIKKMIELAEELGRQVQGDDGEIYSFPGKDSSYKESSFKGQGDVGENYPFFENDSSYKKSSFIVKSINWIKNRFFNCRLPEIDSPFKPGDYVIDCFRRECTVISIDRKGGGILDTVTVRYCDGSLHSYSVMASGFEFIDW